MRTNNKKMLYVMHVSWNWIGLLFNFFWAVVLLTSSYFFLDKGYGALGLAYAFVMSYLFRSTVQIYYSYKYLLVDVK